MRKLRLRMVKQIDQDHAAISGRVKICIWVCWVTAFLLAVMQKTSLVLREVITVLPDSLVSGRVFNLESTMDSTI